MHVLNIGLKVPLTCCVNCMNGITGNVPVAKLDADAPAEMLSKLHGVACLKGRTLEAETQQEVRLFPKVNSMHVPQWRRGECCINCVGAVLGGMSTGNMLARGCDHKDCVGVQNTI